MHKRINSLRYFVVSLFAACLLSGVARAEDTAKKLFEENRASVFQIRVVNSASDEKYSIGSGFAVSSDGLVATNFHVVSSFVHEPDKYRLELVTHEEEVMPIELLSIDVIHDLAIVRASGLPPGSLSIRQNSSLQGDRIYSMGNPQNLGMTIIEGTFNGLVKNSRYQKYLFSGSLNPGMSGGPALNANGEVIGVNVSKGGEQLSFLVPASHLQPLIEKAEAGKDTDFQATISAALQQDQQDFYDQLLNGEVEKKSLGDLKIIGKLTDKLNCWGHDVEEDDIRYAAVHQHCRSEDNIYVSNDLYVGSFAYSFEWITTEELNPLQFYSYVTERFTHSGQRNTRDDEQVTAYKCSARFVELVSGNWKVSTCLRAYKKYQGLYDASLVMASVDHNKQVALARMAATGVSQQNAVAIAQKMLEEIEWTP